MVTTVVPLRDRALEELRATRKAMLGTAWEMALDTRPPQVQVDAMKTLLNLGKAIRALEDAPPADCGSALAIREAPLSAGLTELARARTCSTAVESVVARTNGVLAQLLGAVRFRPI